ncbi:MAG: hypothetical protein RIQ56_85 [Candidatus Parcubacteria bacterium]|jgi:hypothetical protein
MSEFALSTVRQINVDLVNEPGTFATLTETLSRAQVLIFGITVESGHRVSRVHFVVDNTDAALDALRHSGEVVSENTVVAVTILERKVGQITRIARALSEAGVNIDTIYLTSAQEGTKPTIYISATNVSADEVLKCLQSALAA